MSKDGVAYRGGFGGMGDIRGGITSDVAPKVGPTIILVNKISYATNLEVQ